MVGFLQGFAGGFGPSFARSGQQFLNRRAEANQRKLQEQLLQAQIAGAEQEQELRAEQAGIARDDRSNEQNALLTQALNLQNAIDAGRDTGGLTEADIALIGAAGGGDEQFEALNSILAQKAEANAPLSAQEQAELAATDALTQQRLASAEKARRPDVPDEIATLQALGLPPTIEGVKDLARARSSNINIGSKPPSGFERDPDDPTRLRPQAGGPHDPNILANLTDAQAKSRGFASRAEAADNILREIGKASLEEASRSYVGGAVGFIPGLGGVENLIRGEAAQQREQARQDFVTAVLRKESGAVITDDEFRREEAKFFPTATDGPAVVRQKAEARQRAIANLQREGALDPDGEDGINTTRRSGEAEVDLDPANLTPADLDNLSPKQLDELERRVKSAGNS